MSPPCASVSPPHTLPVSLQGTACTTALRAPLSVECSRARSVLLLAKRLVQPCTPKFLGCPVSFNESLQHQGHCVPPSHSYLFPRSPRH